MGVKFILPLAVALLGIFALSEARKEITDIIDSMLPEKKSDSGYYDKRIRPNSGAAPIKIAISAYVLDVYNVDEKNHEFTVQLYLRQHWVDERLVFQPPVGVKNINLDSEHVKKIWIPDTFVTNERKSLKHDFTVSNEMTRISPDGEVLRSLRTTITASCKMDLKWFPFDRNLCSLEIESYANTADEFIYVWKHGPNNKPAVGISEGASGSINKQIKAIQGRAKIESLTSGNYSRVALEFLIARESTRYLQDVYFPSIALPIIAFITMSVGPLQFRVLLSTITMVGIIIFTSLLSMEMPKVSYQTALDFYVFNSSVMIFNVVIVNFVMYHLLTPKSKPTRMRMRQMNGNAEDAKEILPEAEPSEDFNIGRPAFANRFQELLYSSCEWSKYTMPFFFVIFNIIYWPVVLIASNYAGADFLLDEDRS